ncbi:MAG: GAF domain-containing sensor histidine kinase, partial [bacterium]|nr:GAF domain-containing sensor histidine kinase [bacterium]
MPEPSSNTIQFIDPADVDVRHAAFSDDERVVLDSINQRIAAGESLADIMDFLFDSGRSLFPCDRIGLAFVEEGGERVAAHWSRALYEPLLLGKGYAEDLRGSSLATIQETGHLRIINDLEEYLRLKPVSESTALLIEEGVRSSMTCPLIVDGRNVGFLFRSSRKPNSYTREEVLRHQAVAERLSQAVEKAYRLEQLEEANKAYTEMLGFVSHELKSPLASILTDARLLTDGYLGEIDPKQEKKIHSMVRKANFLLNLVREYLDLARIEGGQLELNAKEVDFLAEVLEPCVDIVQAAVQEKEVTVEQDVPEGPMPVDCD